MRSSAIRPAAMSAVSYWLVAVSVKTFERATETFMSD
jgi:hypothetical protein